MDKQSPFFQDTHIDFICACSARDLPPINILKKIRLIYFEFNEIPDDDMLNRIYQIRTRCVDKIENMRGKDTMDHISLANPVFRLEYLERLLMNPPENLPHILRVLDQARKETSELGDKSAKATGSITWADLTSTDDVLSKPIPKNKTGTDTDEEEDDDVDTSETAIA